jgi:SDR family mycofactocin-dependent oxidoreductase
LNRFAGRVALVTGAARGQGRSHAVRLASEGADIIAVDACDQLGIELPYPPTKRSDLDETADLVRKLGRRAITCVSDVRDFESLHGVISAAADELGTPDVVAVNAGILSFGLTWELSEAEWHNVIDVNLTGAWHTTKAVIPRMIERGNGGAVILTASVSGLRWTPFLGHYVASKHGLIGLMRNLANELAPEGIRVNVICPSAVDTPMANDSAIEGLLNSRPGWRTSFQNPMSAQKLTVDEISNALLWLASDEARFVTGVVLPIDAGLAVT